MGENRKEFELIADRIKGGERVLDVGCSDGSLLLRLRDAGATDCAGIELSLKGVERCLSKGLNVLHGDAEEEIVHYRDLSYDVVVLSFALQVMSNPLAMVLELVRVGRRAVVIFPNFGYWRVVKSLLLDGVMPVTKEMPLAWYNTPNIHFCTARDFLNLCRQEHIEVSEMVLLDGGNEVLRQQQGDVLSKGLNLWSHWRSAKAMFVVHKKL